MISVRAARKRLMSIARLLPVRKVDLGNALKFALAEDIRSGVDLPTTDNSAMDGFAIRTKDFAGTNGKNCRSFEIVGVIKAGDLKRPLLGVCQAMKIMTGAQVPKNTDLVVPKEYAVVEGKKLWVQGMFRKGENIRRRGEEIKKGSLVLKRGTVIHPGVVGVLAAVGRKSVCVYRKPKVVLIVTGNELVSPGEKLHGGQVYDSNLWSISAALKGAGIESVRATRVRDRKDILRKLILRGLKNSDVVLLTGGVSVGDYDFVKMILSELKVRKVFWKIAQKPGKPMFVGQKEEKLVFGLPGNPASAFVCFYEYVYPVLRKVMGYSLPFLKRCKGNLIADVCPDRHKTLFLRGSAHRENGQMYASISKRQGSHMLTSFADSNGLIVVPKGRKRLKKGNPVEVDILPYAEDGYS